MSLGLGLTQLGLGLGSNNGIGGGILFPSGLAWDGSIVPTSALSVFDPGGDNAATGFCSLTPEQVFDSQSTARSAPTTTYYVDIPGNGSDANPGTSPAAKLATVSSAITKANATGQSAKIIIDPGDRSRAQSAGGVQSTVDLAIVCSDPNSRVGLGTWDSLAMTLDATFTNCYSMTLANADRVTNRLTQNAYGSNTDHTRHATATALNGATLTNDGYTIDTGKLYIRRLDGTQPTNTNTRVYRTGVDQLRFRAEVNVYLENIDANGGQFAPILYDKNVLPVNAKVLVCKNVTAKYGGGDIQTGARGFGVDGLKGLAYFYGCTTLANVTDGFNGHDTVGTGTVQILTVNCVGNDNGRGSNSSCNGITCHETVKMIDIAGQYLGNHEGSVRHVGTSKMLLVGTMSTDLGNLATPSSNSAFWVDGAAGAAEMWCDRTKAPNASGKTSYEATTPGLLHKRNVAATLGVTGGSGTIDNY